MEMCPAPLQSDAESGLLQVVACSIDSSRLSPGHNVQIGPEDSEEALPASKCRLSRAASISVSDRSNRRPTRLLSPFLQPAPFAAREGWASTRDRTPMRGSAGSLARNFPVALAPGLRADGPAGVIRWSRLRAAAFARSSDQNCGNVARYNGSAELEDLTFKLLPEISPALTSKLPMRGVRRAPIPRTKQGGSSDGASLVGSGMTSDGRKRDGGAYYPLTATAKPTTSSNRQGPVVDYVFS